MLQGALNVPYPGAITPQILHEDMPSARAWRRDTLRPEHWLVPLTESCLAELDAVVQFLRALHVPSGISRPRRLSSRPVRR